MRVGYLAAIPLIPAIVFPLSFVLPRTVRNKLLWVPIIALMASLGLSLYGAWTIWPGAEAGADQVRTLTYQFALIQGKPVSMILQFDPLAAVMVVMISCVALCVAIFSLSYMHGDERIGWYFTVLSLFTGAMLMMALAGDFLLFYMSWEIMGLCSYLLIGFWNTQLDARRASIKAFLTTRIGDVGFAVALAIMWTTAGTLDMQTVLGQAGSWAPGIATAVALLLFFAAMGKSAQFPLHVWLPDAMAGPTPASALIHAATMVAAGVFLVARAMPIFEVSGTALDALIVIGSITALMAALMASVQYDIKRVLAYSTISQLGYMFLGLGTGSVAAGMFHLITHAFFKSLLFLAAGSIIHALSTQDMRKMSGVGRSMKWTTVTFTVGTLALCGVVPFSGFFSKDMIIDHLFLEGHYVAFAVALVTAGLTAFYMTRLWLRVFPTLPNPDAHKAGHESDGKMVGPMLLLAAVTCVIGLAIIPFGEYIGSHTTLPHLPMASLSTVVVLAGLGLGWYLFRGGRSPRALKCRIRPLYNLVVNKFYMDHIAENMIAGGYTKLSEALNWFDKHVINGIVNGVGVMCVKAGVVLRNVQSGQISAYQRMLVVGMFVFLLIAVLASGVM